MCIRLRIKTDFIVINNVFICRFEIHNQPKILVYCIPCLDLDKVHTYMDWKFLSKQTKKKNENRLIWAMCLPVLVLKSGLRCIVCLSMVECRPKRFVNKNQNIAKVHPMFFFVFHTKWNIFIRSQSCADEKYSVCWTFYMVLKSFNLTFRYSTMISILKIKSTDYFNIWHSKPAFRTRCTNFAVLI